MKTWIKKLCLCSQHCCSVNSVLERLGATVLRVSFRRMASVSWCMWCVECDLWRYFEYTERETNFLVNSVRPICPIEQCNTNGWRLLWDKNMMSTYVHLIIKTIDVICQMCRSRCFLDSTAEPCKYDLWLSRYPEVGINQSFAGPMKLDGLRNIFHPLEATNSNFPEIRIFWKIMCLEIQKVKSGCYEKTLREFGIPSRLANHPRKNSHEFIGQGAPSPPFDWTKVDWTKIFQNNGWGATLLALQTWTPTNGKNKGEMGGGWLWEVLWPKISDEIWWG